VRIVAGDEGRKADRRHSQPQALEEKRSEEAKVTYLTEYELNQPRNGASNNSRQYLQHERLAALKSAPGADNVSRSQSNVGDGHATDSSSSGCDSRASPLAGPSVVIGGGHSQVKNERRSEDEMSGSK